MVRGSIALAILAGSVSLATTLRASAQSSAIVSVNAAQPLATLPAEAVGVNTAVWDGNLLDTSVPGLLKQAGIRMLRFPGGSTSDVYHWATNSATAGTGQYINPADTFDNFMKVVTAAGAAPVITTNYGSNAAGTAGGDPNEAAAWVNYANNLKGYGIKYWEIGNEVYGNGEYGAHWEEDLHTSLSPSTYGANVTQFAAAMKAQDPTIKVGAVLTAPGAWPDGVAPDWNSGVLAACGASIDFVIVHWYPQGPGGESDAGLLSYTRFISGMVARVRALISQYCGSNAPNVQILVTETNSVSYNPGKQTVNLVNGLFLADNVMDWLENGATSVDWWDLHNGISAGNNNSSSLYGSLLYGDYGILSNATCSGSICEPAADTPFAPYYGMQMLNDLGKPGDALIPSSSSQPLLTSHAVKQANGDLAVLLINKDPVNAYNAVLNLAGYVPASSATFYAYGKGSASISTTARTGAAQVTIQKAPPYSLTTLLLRPLKSTSNFTASAAPVPATVSEGVRTQVTANVTCLRNGLTNGEVVVQLVNASNTRIAQVTWTGQNFAPGQTLSYTLPWTASSIPGPYIVRVGVYTANMASNPYWNNGAALITVVAPDPSQYNFESSTQGWAPSGGMITDVATSGNEYYLGAQSLDVTFNGAAADIEQAYVAAPAVGAGSVVTFHVWLPAGSQITAIQPYVQQGAAGNWTWTGDYQTISNLVAGAWNTLTVTVPSNAVLPLYQMGVQFFTGGGWSGECYIDSVSW